MRRWCAALALPLVVAGCGAGSIARDGIDTSALDARIERAIRRDGIVGLAVAVIDDGRVVHVAAFGRRDVARDLPLATDSVLYGASLTKVAFADLVLQLVDEGRIDLDTPIARWLPRPLPTYERWSDLAADPRWERLTARILLSHASGFANFRWLEPDRRLRFHSDPGTRYAYSGEGLQLLQFALETGLGLDVGRAIETRVFARAGTSRTAMTWQPAHVADEAEPYDVDGRPVGHARRVRADVAGSMDTTIADQAKLWAAVVRGDGLSTASRAALVATQQPIASAHQFPTLSAETSSDDARIGLASGLGVVVFDGALGRVFYKGGHDDGTGNLAMCVERTRRCVVLLSNDVRAERLYPSLVTMVLGETSMRWAWEYAWYAKDPP